MHLSESQTNRYVPIDGGWRIRFGTERPNKRIDAGIGVCQDDPRRHRRPLYPPADKMLIWNARQRSKIEGISFRPLILAYHGPRFLFDLHSAGGLAGYLFCGLVRDGGPGKWFHQWKNIEVEYANGALTYRLEDPAFPKAQVSLTASALADAVGLVVKYDIRGLSSPASLVWCYGGGSGFFAHYWDSDAVVFNPKDCARERVAWNGRMFTVRRAFDKTDTYIQECYYTAPLFLPEWKETCIRGGGSRQAETFLGDPAAVLDSPARLLGSSGNMAAQRIPVPRQGMDGFIVIGTGRNIEKSIGHPGQAYQAALGRNRDIAGRIVTHTPNPFLDAAMPMAAIVNEATWGDNTVLHGAWSWRLPYLGWRGWYGLTCLGWTELIRQALQNHARLAVIRTGPNKGALGSVVAWEDDYVFCYNMNEVFIDQVRHYFDYTNDLKTMRGVFSRLKAIVGWEERRLQPGKEHLFESCLDVQISDSHWYMGGQTTLASSYMLRANEFLADISTRLGEDPAPFVNKAKSIRAAMQRKLWQPRSGVFAEFLDTRGNRLLHPEPALPTIIHSAEFGAADPLQIYQMLYWADTHLRTYQTIDGGNLFWNSNWSPDYSHWEPFYGDNLNLALTNGLVGRADAAYALIRGVLHHFFQGPTPGGLPSGVSGGNAEFADSISMWVRAVTEGLFGIRVKKPERMVELTPNFPAAWPRAAIRTPHFSYDWKRTGQKETIAWRAPARTAVRLRLPIRSAAIRAVTLNGSAAPYKLEPGVGLTWLCLDIPAGTSGNVVVSCSPRRPGVPAERVVKTGSRFTLKHPGIRSLFDPQGILDNPRIRQGILDADIKAGPGPALFFLLEEGHGSARWIPVRLKIEPRRPIPAKIWSVPRVPKKDLKYWHLVDLSAVFNASSPVEILERVAAEAKPPDASSHQAGFNYWKEHLLNRCAHHKQPPADTAWRAKVGTGGIGWTADGIPFKTSKIGPNIGVVTLAGGYPESLSFPVNAGGRMLYLMLSGVTWPIQSHVVNLRLQLDFADGASETKDLVNPFDISSCWGYTGKLKFDTPGNGFENIGGRFGPEGTVRLKDRRHPAPVDTIAQLVALKLPEGVALARVNVEAVANDIIFGVMGATVLR